MSRVEFDDGVLEEAAGAGAGAGEGTDYRLPAFLFGPVNVPFCKLNIKFQSTRRLRKRDLGRLQIFEVYFFVLVIEQHVAF